MTTIVRIYSGFSPYKRSALMPEIRFTVTKKLNERLLTIAEALGVDKSDCVKSLILIDLRKQRKRGGRDARN